MEIEKYCKFDRTTQEQLQHYVQFCQNHPQMQECRGRRKPPERLWEQLAQELNNMRGPTRTAAKWRATLSHWKYQLRSRARKFKATEGGFPEVDSSDFRLPVLKGFVATTSDSSNQVPALDIKLSPTYDAAVKAAAAANATTTAAAAAATSPGLFDVAADNADPLDGMPTMYIKVPSLPSPSSASSSPSLSLADTSSVQMPLQSPNRYSDVSSPDSIHALGTGKVTLDKLYTALLSSISAREAREERAIEQQEKMTLALQQMNTSFLAMERAFEKFSNKMDKLYYCVKKKRS